MTCTFLRHLNWIELASLISPALFLLFSSLLGRRVGVVALVEAAAPAISRRQSSLETRCSYFWKKGDHQFCCCRIFFWSRESFFVILGHAIFLLMVTRCDAKMQFLNENSAPPAATAFSATAAHTFCNRKLSELFVISKCTVNRALILKISSMLASMTWWSNVQEFYRNIYDSFVSFVPPCQSKEKRSGY